MAGNFTLTLFPPISPFNTSPITYYPRMKKSKLTPLKEKISMIQIPYTTKVEKKRVVKKKKTQKIKIKINSAGPHFLTMLF
jgi:hypothetical protein